MVKRKMFFRWGFVILVLFGTVGLVQQSLNNAVYLPVIIVEPTLTPSLTPTPTATLAITLTPTPTDTPTPTGTPEGKIEIVEIVNPISGEYPLNEYVSIHSSHTESVDLTDWYIRDEQGNKYHFPEAFWIDGDQTVKIWTKFGNDTSEHLYWDRGEEVWNDGGDCAYLRDGNGELMAARCYSQ